MSGLLPTLKARFERNMGRHPGLAWSEIELRLTDSYLTSLAQMEETGGEPDLVVLDGELGFADCAPESPTGRRSLCYDDQALAARKANKPAGSAVGMARRMGIELLTQDQYRALQELGEFDLKTSSWVQTPAKIRTLGGALFGDRRYDTVFIFHNGADSYYAARGFRGWLKV